MPYGVTMLGPVICWSAKRIRSGRIADQLAELIKRMEECMWANDSGKRDDH